MNNSLVTKKHFEDALSVHGVQLTQNEVKTLIDKYGDGQNKIDFHMLSKALGLHSQAITQMKNTQDKIKRLKSAASNVSRMMTITKLVEESRHRKKPLI